MSKYIITGASGQLGRHTLDTILNQKLNPADFVALARDPSVLADYAARGFEVRKVDYSQPETFPTAFADARKILFISSNALGQRMPQHQAVIDFVAAQEQQPQLVYTSLVHAGTSKLICAIEHNHTEAYIREKLTNYVLLRNGWYIENYTYGLDQLIAGGQKAGSARQGKIAGVACQDLAEAAVAVLLGDFGGQTMELVGDEAFTLDEFAATVAQVTGKPFSYVDLPEEHFVAMLQQFGVPEDFAKIAANTDVLAAEGELNDDSKQLSRLIGRPTTPLKQVIARVLKIE